MAVSDLLFPLVVIPDQMNKIITELWHWHVSGSLGATFCKLFVFTSSVSHCVSVQSFVWIATDRFVAVVFPMKLGLVSSKIIVSTWVLAGAFYFPSLVSSGLAEYGNNFSQQWSFSRILLVSCDYPLFGPVVRNNRFIHCNSDFLKN